MKLTDKIIGFRSGKQKTKVLIIIIICICIIFGVTFYYFTSQARQNVSPTNGKQIGLLYMKPGILRNSEFVRLTNDNKFTSKSIKGTDYAFENTIKYKDEFVLSSTTKGRRAFINNNNKVNYEEDKAGVSAIYEDDTLLIKGLNDVDSTLVINGNSKNYSIKLTGTGYISQIQYDAARHTAYVFSDWMSPKKSMIYTVDINNGEVKEYEVGPYGSPDNCIEEQDELIYSSNSKLTIFNKNTLMIRHIDLPYKDVASIHAFQDKYYVTFVEGKIVEYDKNFTLLKEYTYPDSSKVTRTKMSGNLLYSLSPGSFTKSGKDILYIHDLNDNMKVSQIDLPKKKAFCVNFAVIE